MTINALWQQLSACPPCRGLTRHLVATMGQVRDGATNDWMLNFAPIRLAGATVVMGVEEAA